MAGTLTGTLRLFAALIAAGLIGYFGMKGGIANRAMVSESYVEPVRDFFRRYGMGLALLLLALVGLYRISDIVLGVISNVFYQDVGFTKSEIATVTKVFGLLMTITGGFLGGMLAVRYGVMKILFLGALLSMATNLLFILLEHGRPANRDPLRRDRRRQSFGRPRQRSLCRVFVQPDEYQFHRRSIRDFLVADDAAPEDHRRVFRHDCRGD